MQLHDFLRLWSQACDRKQLPKLLAEVVVAEAFLTPAARLGREHLFACALGPWEADDVLSEIALLTMTDAGDETWHLRRLNGQQAAAMTGGHLSAHFARSFIHAIRAPIQTGRPARAGGRGEPGKGPTTTA